MNLFFEWSRPLSQNFHITWSHSTGWWIRAGLSDINSWTLLLSSYDRFISYQGWVCSETVVGISKNGSLYTCVAWWSCLWGCKPQWTLLEGWLAPEARYLTQCLDCIALTLSPVGAGLHQVACIQLLCPLLSMLPTSFHMSSSISVSHPGLL